MRKTFKKIATMAMAAIMTVGSAFSAFAEETTYEAEFGAQFNVDVNDTVGEWPSFSDSKVTFTEGVEATFTYTFDSQVKFAGNYVAINTNYPYSEDVVADFVSVKLDGVDVEVGPAFLNNEGTDGGLRLTLTNLWNGDITTQPMDASATPAFTTVEIKFIVGEAADTDTDTDTDADTDTDTNTDTDADTNTDTDTDADSNADSNADADANANAGATTPDTGDSSMVAMYGLVALVAAAVVLKRRTVTE